MKSDVIAESPLKFTHADLKDYGYIMIHGAKGTWTFHRDMVVNDFPDAPMFDSLDEAIAELPSYDGETFVMAFEADSGQCDRLWFTELQEEANLTSRLNQYRMCYGGYGTAIYRGR